MSARHRPSAASAAFFAALATLSGAAVAQVRHRHPLNTRPNINYGYDNRSGSGCRDYTCGSRCYDGHTGTDYPVGMGTTVVASAAGTVVATNNGCANTGYRGNTCGGRCGNYVQLSHSDGTRTIYCHMQLNSLAVSRGQRVTCGQTLGRSASSGSSTGPHLHFGWQRGGVSRDPFSGSCSNGGNAWVDQEPYPQSAATRCACVPSTETCNGRDDDCDGRVDDGIAARTCGRGRCLRSVSCANGRFATCTPGNPVAETCNGMDDDCDGRVDDGVAARSCGVGRCRRTVACANGRFATCTPGAAIPEVCGNSVDDDCDGMTDEGCTMDAGTARDSGVARDVGVDLGPPDAGVVDDDTGVVEDDAGPVEDDASVEDAGVAEDASVEDAGVEDAGGEADAPEFVDVGEEDAGDVAPDDGTLPADDSCGCRAAGAGTGPGRGAATGVLLALGAVLVRRRRRGQAG